MREGPDGSEAAFAGLIAAVAVWSWVGFVLAETGWFTKAGLLGLALPASAVAGLAAFRSVWRVARPIAAAEAIALGVVLVLAAVPFRAPGEPLLEGQDASIYLNAGRALARHGALVYQEPVLSLIPSGDWAAVLDRELHPPRVLNLFPGGMQIVPGVSTVRPGFFHLLPVWVGSSELIAGSRGAYLVAPFAGLLALVAFWMLARALVALVPATLATALLASNVAFQWFSRLPMTEVTAAALVLTGLAFGVAFVQRPSRASAVLSGAAFGLAAFARVDVLLFVIPLVTAFAVVQAIERRGRQQSWWLISTLVLLTTHALIHAWLFADLYSERIAFHMLRGRFVSTASRVIPPIVLALGIVAWLLVRRATARWLARATTVAFTAGLVVAAVRFGPELVQGALPILFTTIGMALVLVALAVWIASDRSSPSLLVAGLWLVSTLVYAESARDTGDALWMLRRYVPVVLPLSVLALAVLADKGWRRGGVWRGTGVLVLAGMTAIWAARTAPLLRAEPLSDLHDQLARIAAAMPANAVVVTDVTTPSHFGLSLSGSFGHSVLFVMPSMETARVLDALAARLLAEGRPMVVAVGQGAADALGLAAQDLVGLELSPARVESVAISVPEAASDHVPRHAVTVERRIVFHTARPMAPRVAPATFEIGERDLTFRGSGFYGVEQMGSAYARWTAAAATMYLPRLAPLASGRLLLRLAAPRPVGIAPPSVSLRLGGRVLGSVGPLGPGFAEFAVPLESWALDALARGGAMLSLSAPTFSPADDGVSGDRRQLGVAVDWVRLEPQ